MTEQGPAPASDILTARPLSRPSVSVRLARVSDVPALVRFYRGLSEEARRHYHPFPTSRGRLFLTYLGITVSQSALRWLMRRRPAAIVGLAVATVDGGAGVVGCCTIRGVVRPGREPAARIGVAVAESHRGLGIARQLELFMGTVTLGYGVHYQVATVFRSSEPGVRLLASLGHRLTPIEDRDPQVPDEPQFETELDLRLASPVH